MDLAQFFNLTTKATDDLASGGRTGAGGARAESKPKSGGGYGARAGETITGNLARGGDGKFTSAGNASAKKPAKPKPSQRRAAKPKGKKPPADRAAASAAKRQENRANVVKAMADSDTGLQPAAFAALMAFGDGTDADPAMLKTLAGTGLIDQAADGSFRLSPQGRTFLAAANAGDTRRALDAMSKAADLTSSRATAAQTSAEHKRQTAARRIATEARRAARAQKPEAGDKPAKGGGGGSGAKKPKAAAPPPQQGEALTDQYRALAGRLSEGDALEEWEVNALIRNGLATYDKKDNLILTARGIRALQPPKQKSFAVFKDHAGRYRWLAVSSTAFRDRDKEIVSTKALIDDVARTDLLPNAGPLRFWHVPGLDIGDCDYAAVDGRSLIESGTFRNERYGQALKDSPQEWHISLGFVHPADQPDAQGVFNSIRRFERSIVPAGRASNPFTRLVIKEVQMLTSEKEAGLRELFKGDEALLQQLLAGVAQTEKAADAAGVAYKAADEAMPPEIAAEVKAEGAMPDELAIEDELIEEEPAGEFVGDMTPADFSALLTQSLTAALAPLMEAVQIEAKMSGALSELKDLVGGYTKQKDASDAERAAEIVTLKAKLDATTAQQQALALQLAELLGDQPAQKGYRASVEGPPPSSAALKAATPAITDDLVSFFGIGAGQ